MPAYVVVEVEVTDPVRYQDYMKLAQVSIPAHGGRYLVRGGAVTTLEGEWSPKRLVVVEFPSVEAAKAWHDSPDYREARAVRALAAKFKLIVVEGFTAPL